MTMGFYAEYWAKLALGMIHTEDRCLQYQKLCMFGILTTLNTDSRINNRQQPGAVTIYMV